MKGIERTAYHEAGHALMHWLFGNPISEVWIDPAKGGGCLLANDWLEDMVKSFSSFSSLPHLLQDRSFMRTCRRNVCCKLAGDVALCLAMGKAEVPPWNGWQQDSREAFYQVRHFLTPPIGDVPEYMLKLSKLTTRLCRKHWARLETLKTALVRKRRLKGSEVERILKEATE